MNNKKSQKERIMELLEERGYQGIGSFEGYLHLYIPRISAIIYNIRKDGISIFTKKGIKRGEVIYYLGKFQKEQTSLLNNQ